MKDERAGAREVAPAPSAAGEARAKSNAAPNRAQMQQEAPSSDATPGTGWGERSRDPVRRTDFTAARTASDHIVLRYEYSAGLRALGIYPTRGRVHERDRGELGFAEPPRW